jgi:signal peptidase II
MRRPTIIAFLTAALVVVLDQGAKAWIVGVAGPFGVGPPIAGPLRLTLVQNTGISYGLLQDGGDWTRWLLALFALVVSAFLARWALRAETPLTGLGIGFILGGALGNVADRAMRGAVVDFIDARAMHFPWIFNLADAAISVGIVLLLAEGFLAPRRQAS